MSDFLSAMMASSRARVAAARAAGGRQQLRPATAAAAGRLISALSAAPQLALIAEVKRSSPSRGDIAPELDAVAQARAYEAAGADAVSVLTEPTRFGGSLGDLREVCAAVTLPVLRKDFIVDRFQIWEAADAGAAAVLLIVAGLSDEALADLFGEAERCGLDALVEVHDEGDLERALIAGARLVGINNRNLRTLDVDLGVTERLAPLLPGDVLAVGESGVLTAADAARLRRAGAAAVLVGEALVRAGSEAIPARVREIRGVAAEAR